MNTARVTAGFFACIVVSGAAGFFIGRATSPPGPGEPRATLVPLIHDAAENDLRISSDPTPTNDNATPTSAKSFNDRMREIVALSSEVRRAYEAEVLFEAISSEEMPAAFESLRRLAPGSVRSDLLEAFFQHWGGLAPRVALEAAKHLPARDRPGAEAAALEGWARKEPASAWAVAKELVASNPAQSGRFFGVLRELARADLGLALAESIAISSDFGRRSARNQIIDAALKSGSMDALLREVQKLKSPGDQENWTREAFALWAGIDSEAPIAALSSIADQTLARSAMSGFLTGWAEADPAGAFEYALAHRGDPLVEDALGPVLQKAIHGSSEADVQAYVTAITERGAFDSVAKNVIPTLAQLHPELALKLASSASSDDDRRFYTGMSLATWSRDNFAAASVYFEQMPYGNLKRQTFHNVARQALDHDGGVERVVQWIDSFPAADRKILVQNLVMSQVGNHTQLRPGAAPILARLVAGTPGLPDEIRQRAQRFFGPVPTP